MQLRSANRESKRSYSLHPTVIQPDMYTSRPFQYMERKKRSRQQEHHEQEQVKGKRSKTEKDTLPPQIHTLQSLNQDLINERKSHEQTIQILQQSQLMTQALHQECHRLIERQHATDLAYTSLQNMLGMAEQSKTHAIHTVLLRVMGIFSELEHSLPTQSEAQQSLNRLRQNFIDEFAEHFTTASIPLPVPSLGTLAPDRESKTPHSTPVLTPYSFSAVPVAPVDFSSLYPSMIHSLSLNAERLAPNTNASPSKRKQPDPDSDIKKEEGDNESSKKPRLETPAIAPVISSPILTSHKHKRGRPTKFAPEVERHGEMGFFYRTEATTFPKVQQALQDKLISSNLYLVLKSGDIYRFKLKEDRAYILQYHNNDKKHQDDKENKDGPQQEEERPLYSFLSKWVEAQLKDDDIVGYMKRPPETAKEEESLRTLLKSDHSNA